MRAQTTIYAFLLSVSCHCAVAQTPSADQDFDTWPVTWTPDPYLGESPQGDYTNAGWTLHEGILSEDAMNLWPPRSEPLMAWLAHTETNGPSRLETPYLPNGLAQVSFYTMNFLNGYSVGTVAFSTNRVTWETVATFTNAFSSATWVPVTSTTQRYEPGWVRIVRTGADSDSQRMGLDDVTIYHPCGAVLTNLMHAPASPTIDDAVHVYADVSFHPRATGREVRLYYRFDGDPGFSWRPMALTTGTTYRTATPIPAGRAGTVFYYVEARYGQVPDGPRRLPAGGPTHAASYISVGSGGGDLDPRQVGPSSRRTPLLISEIMYHPAPRQDGRNLEFVELHNSAPVDWYIGGYSLTGDVDFTFPDDLWIGSNSYLVVAADPQAVSTLYPTTGVMGPFTGRLSNGGGTLRIRNQWGASVLTVDFDDDPPWPTAADGAGHSLVCGRPDYGENDVRAWRTSHRVGGSPGYALPAPAGALEQLQINEFLAHTDIPEIDFIELHNYGTEVVDATGCVLTDDPATNKYVITNGVIAANGYLALDQDTLGFALSAAGDDIYLIRPDGKRVLDAVRFEAQANGVSVGRWPDGAGAFHPLSVPTPGAPNASTSKRVADVVINELMYHPISGSDDDEYIELHNRGAGAVDLSYWRLTDGVGFVFPPGTAIPAGGYLVVARDAANLPAKYPQLNSANLVGDYSGRLSDSGERIELVRPDDPRQPLRDFVVVDTVTYSDGWGTWTDGDGSSLELVDPRTDNRREHNWGGSDETAKAPWTDVDFTDYVSDGDTTEFDIFFILANQRSEFLVDDITFAAVADDVNLVVNSAFDGDSANWLAQGNHWLTQWEAQGGYGDDGGVLRVHALGQGGVRSMATARRKQFDRAETTLSAAPTVGAVYRTRAKVRWQAGWPYLRLSLGWYWHEALVELAVPDNLGTPGARNSRFVTNAPPAIWDIAHAPLLPAAGEAVLVSCRVDDPDGLVSVRLEHRDTSRWTYTDTAMRDDGLVPDAVAGDGIYTAQFPGLGSGVIAGFRVVASDATASRATRHAPGQDRARDALVRFGDPQPHGRLIDYALWVSPENETLWESWPTRANGEVYTTVSYNGWRVVYDATVRWRGNGRSFSDIRSASYSVTLPKTQPLIGDNEVKMDIPSRNGSNGTYLQEYHAYWMARVIGHAAGQVRPMRVHVNGSNLLRQDLEIPTRDFCSYWYGDDDPHVFEHRAEHVLQVFRKTPSGELNMAKYRHGLQKKRTSRPDAWYRRFPLLGRILELADTSVRDARLRALVHPFGFCAYSAVNHVAGNVDVYGYSNAHNGSAYVSPQRPLRWHLVDMDPVFVRTMPLYPRQEIGEIVNRPYFVRTYRRILRAIADGPLQPDVSDKNLDDWYRVLLSEGHRPNDPQSIKDYVAQRLVDIEAELATHEGPFAITTAGGNNFTTADRVVTLEGTAAFDIAAFALNDLPLRVTHPAADTWQATFGLPAGTNRLTVQGLDSAGSVVTSDTVVVTSTAPAGTPAEDIVITEVMYHPVDRGAEFVEIHNRSATQSYDLYGWRLLGADHTFALGAVVPPGGYRIVTDDRQLYTATHTNAEIVIAEFDGSLDNGGETISLLMPAGTNRVTIDTVCYDDAAPWPASADGLGPSLQLRDARRDNDRVANWAVHPVVLYTPGAPNSVATSLPPIPVVWINELMPVNAGFALDGAGDADPWLELYNASSSSVDLGAGFYLSDTYTNLLKWPVPAGRGMDPWGYRLVWMDGEEGETTTGELHAGFTLPAPTGSVVLAWTGAGNPAVLDAWNYAGVPTNTSVGYYPDGDDRSPQVFHMPTPETANNASSLVAEVSINEWMARNSTTLEDPDGPAQFDDWIELYNAGPVRVNLTGFYLTDDPANPSKFTIPLGTSIAAGDFLIVWADEDGPQNAPGRVHANFKLQGDGEAIGLLRPDGVAVDTVVFGPQERDISEGRYADGGSWITPMPIPTPGGANILWRLEVAAVDAGSVDMQWRTRPGWWYQFRSATDLSTNTVWSAWGTPRQGDGGTMMTNVATDAAAGPRRYYRIEQQEP